MGKRRSETGIRGKRAKPSSAHISPAPDNTLRSNELLSTRIPSPIQNSSMKDAQGSIHRHRTSKRQGNLKTRIKYFSRDIILSRWTVLDEGGRAQVQGILHSIEMPVLARHMSEQKKLEAQSTVGSLTRTLSKRLPKMVFPPKTKEENFDYDALAHSNQDLKLQLAASLKSNASLKVELETERVTVRLEQQELEEMEASL